MGKTQGGGERAGESQPEPRVSYVGLSASPGWLSRKEKDHPAQHQAGGPHWKLA